MLVFRKIRRWLFAPKSKFHVGECVQIAGNGDYLMTVIEICTEPRMKEPFGYTVNGLRSKTGLRRNLFPESKLEPFDWYYAYRKV